MLVGAEVHILWCTAVYTQVLEEVLHIQYMNMYINVYTRENIYQ